MHSEDTNEQRPPDIESDFVYDVVARCNETLIATIDAIDTSLTAILAGDIAVAIFMIDKVAAMPNPSKFLALLSLAGSMLACAVGYFVRPQGRTGDGIEPGPFISDISERQEEAVVGAIQSFIISAEANIVARFLKRLLAIVAIGCLIAGVGAVALARLAAF